MSVSGLIKINNKIELNVTSLGEELSMMCDVKGYSGDSILLHYPPKYKEKARNLERNKTVLLNYYTHSGVIMLESQIKEAVKRDVIVINIPIEKKRVQRREFFRVGIQRPVDISFHDGEKTHHFVGKTVDLSGGGVKFWTEAHIRVGFIADLSLKIGDLCDSDEPVKAKGRILYSRTHDSRFSTKSGYLSVVKFGEVSNKSQQLIMKACFSVQIDMRKKGLI